MACCLICGPELWSYSHSDNAAHRACVAIAAPVDLVALAEALLAFEPPLRVADALPATGDTVVRQCDARRRDNN